MFDVCGYKIKMFDVCGFFSIMKTLERYQKINYGPPDVNARSIQEELVSHF